MKRTTYILIGMLVAGLIVASTGVIVLSFLGEERRDYSISMDGEKAELDLKGVHTIKVFVSNTDKRNAFVTEGQMLVTTSDSVGTEKISYSKNQYLKVNRKNDTLLIHLDLRNDIPEKFDNDRSLLISNLNMQIAVNSTLQSIITDVEGLLLNIKDVKSDSLSVHAYRQTVCLNSCELRSFGFGGYACSFEASDSEMEDFHLNMDGVNSWKFHNTKVGTEFLSGSGNHSSTLQKGECRRVIWEPYNADAQLELTIHEKSEIIIAP